MRDSIKPNKVKQHNRQSFMKLNWSVELKIQTQASFLEVIFFVIVQGKLVQRCTE